MAEARNAKNSVTVPQLTWCGDIDAELVFPDKWEVMVCTWAGANVPKMSDEDFRRALARPINSPPLRDLARGKTNVVIVFDDISRPTKVYDIVPFVLEELSAAGVEDRNIQFICALGCHGAMNTIDLCRKIGADIVARYNVFNHNIYENCTYIGTTSRGTPVSINTEFVNADLKIGIGGMVPHGGAGYGGGGKIIMPGIASMETITAHHRKFMGPDAKPDPRVGRGKVEGNPWRQETDEMCLMSGLDFKIDVMINQKRDAVAVFAGKPVDQFYEGVKLAKEHYRSIRPASADVVVVNVYGKANEPTVGMQSGRSLLPESGGTFVLVSNNPYSEVVHYLMGRFGNHIAGPLWHAPKLDPLIKKFIFLMPYRHLAGAGDSLPAEEIHWASTWEDVIGMLQADYPDGAKVAVVPDGTIQFFN